MFSNACLVFFVLQIASFSSLVFTTNDSPAPRHENTDDSPDPHHENTNISPRSQSITDSSNHETWLNIPPHFSHNDMDSSDSSNLQHEPTKNSLPLDSSRNSFDSLQSTFRNLTQSSNYSSVLEDIIGRFEKKEKNEELFNERESENATRAKKSALETENSVSNATKVEPIGTSRQMSSIYFDNELFMGPDYRTVATNARRWPFQHHYSLPTSHSIIPPTQRPHRPEKPNGVHFGMPSAGRWTKTEKLASSNVPAILASKVQPSINLEKMQHTMPPLRHSLPPPLYPLPSLHGRPLIELHNYHVPSREVLRPVYTCCPSAFASGGHENEVGDVPLEGRPSENEKGQKSAESSPFQRASELKQGSCFPLYDSYSMTAPHPFMYRQYRPYSLPFKWFAKSLIFG